MGVFDKLFGKGRDAAAAKKAEAQGDLARAVELWLDAQRPEEAARVMLLRGDAETEPRARLQHYTQAVRTAPNDHQVKKEATSKRCELIVTMAGEAALSAVVRRDVLEAARDLEAIGEPARAAAAYHLVGDAEGEARALAAAGEIDKLEDLLSAEEARERERRRATDLGAEIDLQLASGRRREALEIAERLAKEREGDLAARDRAASIRARRVTGPIARVVLRGRPLSIVLGDEVVLGRTEGTLLAASHAVSRRHLRIGRTDGKVVAQDLETRNGTQLRGMNVVGALEVGDGLELKLGREVALRLRPSPDLEGFTEIELGGRKYVAPLGPAKLPISGWRLEQAHDGWIELCADGAPAYLGEVALASRAALLSGDRVSAARSAEPVLEVLASG
jgi:hypothetical protein